MFDNFFSKAHELTEKGEPFVTATVVRAEKPTSGKPGDKAIITIDGVMHGWIGGSCAQPTVVKEGLKALADDESRLIRLSTDPGAQTGRQGLLDLPMTCFSGGTLEIFVEPQRPKPRLMIIGNLPVAQALAHLGHALNYHVIAVDPDTKGASMPHANQVITELDALGEAITPITYVVIATHGHFDELALEKALNRHAPYIGLVSSQKRAHSVREYLEQAGYAENDLTAFKAPAGLDIHARRGDEIALSIMAEIVEKRRTAEEIDLALFGDSAQSARLSQKETAIDPICQMEVDIETAKYTYDYEGTRYYFCCPACKRVFSQEPEAVLTP